MILLLGCMSYKTTEYSTVEIGDPAASPDGFYVTVARTDWQEATQYQAGAPLSTVRVPVGYDNAVLYCQVVNADNLLTTTCLPILTREDVKVVLDSDRPVTSIVDVPPSP